MELGAYMSIRNKAVLPSTRRLTQSLAAVMIQGAFKAVRGCQSYWRGQECLVGHPGKGLLWQTWLPRDSLPSVRTPTCEIWL